MSLPNITEVTTEKQLAECVDYLICNERFAWDHETRAADYAKNPTKGALMLLTMKTDLISFSTTREAFVIPTGNITTRPKLPEETVFNMVKPLMQDRRITKLGWNAKFDMHAMANYGVWVQNYEDIMLMAYLLNENLPASLKVRCKDVNLTLHKFDFKKYWKARAILSGELPMPKRGHKPTMEELEAMEEEYIAYSADDAIATILLDQLYRPQIEEEVRLNHIYTNLRNPAVRTLFRMERRGMRTDVRFLDRIAKHCKGDIDEAEADVFRIAGRHFNLGSTKQLGEVLYEDMGLPVLRTTAKNTPSTDKATLDMLAQQGYDIAQAIARWRRPNKLYSTYIGPTSSMRAQIYPWGYIHPSYNPTGTKTGRLSCSQPNAQQMPRSGDKSYDFRRAFTASDGHVLIGGDYSQIELRVMAHMSQDPTMGVEYRKDIDLAEALIAGVPLKDDEGNDLYTCSDIHQKTADACHCTRQLAKNINFGLLYGMGYNKLADVLTASNWDNCVEEGRMWDPLNDLVTPELAKDFIDLFFDTYPNIKQYQKMIEAKCMKQGFITTRFGQKRRLPDVYSVERGLQMAACRQGINTTIQGHVGELMLHCMNVIEGTVEVTRKELQDAVDCLRDCRYRLFLQVHDEVLGEAPIKYAYQCIPALTTIFQRPMPPTESNPYYGYRVPLVFEAKTGLSWHKVH